MTQDHISKLLNYFSNMTPEKEPFRFKTALQECKNSSASKAEEAFSSSLNTTGAAIKKVIPSSNWKEDGRPRSPYYYPRV